jgi:hypothetical protein
MRAPSVLCQSCWTRRHDRVRHDSSVTISLRRPRDRRLPAATSSLSCRPGQHETSAIRRIPSSAHGTGLGRKPLLSAVCCGVFSPGPERGYRGCYRQDGNVENALQAAAGHRGSGASAGMTRRPAVPGARPVRRPVCQRAPCRFAADLASPHGMRWNRSGRIIIRPAVRPVLRSLRRLRPPAPSCLPARAEGGTEVKLSEGRCAVPISHCGPLPGRPDAGSAVRKEADRD